MIRIIAGKYRRALIKDPDFSITRPMSDRVRESIFSSLQFYIQNKNVLDLFAGSGAIGIEAVSRGAKFVLASELNKKIYHNILECVEKYRIVDYQVVNQNALNVLDKIKNQKFDLIFLDPPHKEEQVTIESFKKIFNYKILNKGGIIVYKTDLGNKLIPDNMYKIIKTKQYAKNTVFFLEYNEVE
ncbi:16S rRNA (guanine(966)-N(2))-methyltransferase RsmD [Mesomycoplasma conjunctivae]|uniref:16S rRNA (guanine(966)-N(2))-methyltransferase RsmD n=1 Tax=Mesomycoplasma conjunctivae TaxID=45361 RepID=UPI003DA2235F